ncbi:MAG TPA: class I SAM-dependent methyltransferase [Vicinamibacterales bacterium]
MTPATTVLVCDPARYPVDFAAVKARQRAMWASGDFAVVGTTLQIVGETLCEAVDIRSGERVLDVAAGNGNATLAAARRFARVVSTDYLPELLDHGRRRAAAEGLDVLFETADAEALPFAGGDFDVVLSTFGVMFAPDHRRGARELLRVCRPGGRIGLACWTPGGFVGRLFRTVAVHVPPIPGVASPLLWGNADYLESLFERGQTIASTPRQFAFRYASAEHFVDVFRAFYGPMHKAFDALDAAGQMALEREVIALLRQADEGAGRGLVIPAEYLEVVVRA